MQRICGKRLALPLILLTGLAIFASTATAGTITESTPGIPLDLVAPNDCTGEAVLITGFYHLLISTTTGTATMTTKAYTNYQQSSGVALITGTKYQANLTDHQYEQSDLLGGEADMSVDDNYELVSNGPSPNMIVRVRWHAHIDVLGVPHASVDSIDAYCAGRGGKTPLP